MSSLPSQFIFNILLRYKLDQVGFLDAKNGSGVYVDVDNVIEETISSLQIGTKTLTTRVGGIIGVGKNLFWLLVFFVSYLGTALSFSINSSGSWSSDLWRRRYSRCDSIRRFKLVYNWFDIINMCVTCYFLSSFSSKLTATNYIMHSVFLSDINISDDKTKTKSKYVSQWN